MRLLTEDQLDLLAAKVKQAETKTDAEIVTVLAENSDEYLFIPTLWAAILALLTPGLLIWSPLWLEHWELVTAQLTVFAFCALIFRNPFVRYRLVPDFIKRHRAALVARQQFIEQNLHHTQNRTGILIFVSEAEHYVEILVDQGISEKVDNQVWNDVITNLTIQVKQGNVFEGFQVCVEEVTDIASETHPATHTNNELSDRLIVI